MVKSCLQGLLKHLQGSAGEGVCPKGGATAEKAVLLGLIPWNLWHAVSIGLIRQVNVTGDK